MCTDSEKKILIQTILQSRDFKDSPVNRNLLLYLFHHNLSKTSPKETSIAIDVFGKNSDFNSNKDSTVRSHVHMLRNKLNQYYRTAGRNEKIQLVIPKGHYKVEFIGRKTRPDGFLRLAAASLKRWETAAIVLLTLTSAFLLILQIRSSRNASFFRSSVGVGPQDEIWGPFFKNRYPVSIVMGDDFLLDEYNPEFKRYRQIRDWKIDSENELMDFLKFFPKTNLWKSEITAIPFGGIDNLMDILPIIYTFHGDVSVHLSSTFSLESIRNRNIIFIGEFKNLRILNKILYNTPVRYRYNPDERVGILGNHGDTLKTFLRIQAPYDQKDKYNVDYSLLIKMPGFRKENILFIVGFGYPGRLERTKSLGDPKRRAELVRQIRKASGRVPEYFIALFEVKSIERTGFTNEMKYFMEISRDFFNLERTP
jgi:hypothetical protein